MARLLSVRFEVRHPGDDSRRELSFVQDFMWILRATQERTFPALTTIDLHVYAKSCPTIMLCSDHACALFCERDGPSDVDWSRWCHLALGSTLLLNIFIHSPEVESNRLRTAVMNQLSFLGSRLNIHIYDSELYNSLPLSILALSPYPRPDLLISQPRYCHTTRFTAASDTRQCALL